MREHPIPQDIVGYRFHIVGNMTIKQFAEVALGVFIAFLLYKTNLLFIIKWPLMGLSVAIGAALAFVPFEERALDHWLITFIRVIYRPTKFYWKRDNPIPDLFLYEQKKSTSNKNNEVDLSPARRERIKEYMLSLRQEQLTTFDQERQQSISDIMNAFGKVSVTSSSITHLDKPSLKVRVRNIGRDEFNSVSQLDEYGTVVEEQVIDPSTELSDYQQRIRESVEFRTPLAVNEVAQDIAVPEQHNINVDAQTQQDESAQVSQQPTETDGRVYVQNEQVQQAEQQIGAAVYNQQLPFPSKPEKPNKLVGMVLTPQNELVNDAIVEIKNQSGSTVRAVKTNALGQFFVTTPLPDGTYTLETERGDLQFSNFSVQLQGEVVDPIEIRSIV